MSDTKKTNEGKSNGTPSKSGSKPRTSSGNSRQSNNRNSSASGTTKKRPASEGRSASVKKQEIPQPDVSPVEEHRPAIPFLREILLLVAIGFCAVMFLGNLGIAGSLGDFLEVISKGVSGKILGYVFPLILLLALINIIFFWMETDCWIHIGGGTLIFFGFAGMFQAFSSSVESIKSLSPVKDAMTSAGGMVAIFLNQMLFDLVGKPGAIVVFVILVLIGVILLTGKSLLGMVRSASDNISDTAKISREQNRIESRAREERQALREQERQKRIQQQQIAQAEAARKPVLSNTRIGEAQAIEPAPLQPSEKNIAKSKKKKDQGQTDFFSDRPKNSGNSGSSDPNVSGSFHSFSDDRDFPSDPRDVDNSFASDVQGIPASVYENDYSDVEFREPMTAQRRPRVGVTKNTKIMSSRPDDRNAREMTMDGNSQVQVVSKNSGSSSAKRLTSESDFDLHAEDIFSDENMSKTDPSVAPPPVITPSLKPRKDKRTLTEISQLDGDSLSGLSSRNSSPIPGLERSENGQSYSEMYAKKKKLNPNEADSVFDDPMDNNPEDDTVAKDFVLHPVAEELTEEEKNLFDSYIEHSASANISSGVSTKKVIPTAEKPEPKQNTERTFARASSGGGRFTSDSSMNSTSSGKTESKEEPKIGTSTIVEVASREYVFPPIDLLHKNPSRVDSADREQNIRFTATTIQRTLDVYGVNAKVTGYTCGPTITRYEIQPEVGVKVNKILSLSDEFKLSLAAPELRFEAPIPGKTVIGIEVPNKNTDMVTLREIIESRAFKDAKSNVSFVVGKDISGEPVVADIAKMPHLLIAGATNSGKSVCINSMICSLIYKSKPSDVKMIMIDPKVVELSMYNGIPHLLLPVVTDCKKAAGALNWAVVEMERRYKVFETYKVRDIGGYNHLIRQNKKNDPNFEMETMPQIIIIIDELADLMMVSQSEVEFAIARLTQLARAAGIHVVIATQRPSVNVITGVIKANVPSRIAFSVASKMESRIILDNIGPGAETLLGKGDMLFAPTGQGKPVRIQGAYISDEEIESIVDFLINQGDVEGSKQEDIALENFASGSSDSGSSSTDMNDAGRDDERDDLFIQAGRYIIDKEKASIGNLQRVFKIGFNRAARIMDQLADAGVVGEEEGTKPRKILMTADEFEDFVSKN